MTKKHTPRIVEIILKQGKKNPLLSHAIGVLFPCNHKRYLGIVRTPKELLECKDKNWIRVDTIKIWTPTVYDVNDRSYCRECPNDLIWLNDLPKVKEVEKFEEVEL